MPIWHAIILGFIEGLTEFLPVSSTGHILLAGHFLGFHSPGKSFEVLIQLGAIMAVLFVYLGKLVEIARSLPDSPRTRRFVLGVLLAFLPAGVIGLALHDFIKHVLFESPVLICVMLVLGGIILLAIDRTTFSPVYHDARDIPPRDAFQIGIIQCLAMIPGVSRSGSTIVGALLLGADKRAAAEFSFFLAMPTMIGAFALDLYKNSPLLKGEDMTVIAVGFVTAFITATFVVRYALAFIGNHGFAPFAWWRIGVGAAGLAALAVFG
jgi:undecaprenyl-diphosphatase